jgi:hypothetical protein
MLTLEESPDDLEIPFQVVYSRRRLVAHFGETLVRSSVMGEAAISRRKLMIFAKVR